MQAHLYTLAKTLQLPDAQREEALARKIDYKAFQEKIEKAQKYYNEVKATMSEVFIMRHAAWVDAEKAYSDIKKKLEYKAFKEYPAIRKKYEQTMADFYQVAVKPEPLSFFHIYKDAYLQAVENFRKQKNSNKKDSSKYLSAQKDYQTKRKIYKNHLNSLKSAVTEKSKTYMEAYDNLIKANDEIAQEEKKLEPYLNNIFMLRFKQTSEALVTELFMLSKYYHTALLDIVDKQESKHASVERDSQFKIPWTFYQVVFRKLDPDTRLTPLQWMTTHAEISKKEKDEKSINTSMPEILLKWMHDKMGIDSPEDLPADEKELNALYNKAANHYDNPQSSEVKKAAVRTWLRLLTEHTHKDSLKKLLKHFSDEKDGCHILLKKMEAVLDDQGKWQSLSGSYQITNILALAYIDALASPNVAEDPFLYDEYSKKLASHMGIKELDFYFECELLLVDPESRNWYRKATKEQNFFKIVSQNSYKVAAAASFAGCPVEFIDKIFNTFDKHLNNTFEGRTGLAHAAHHDNLPVVEWFLDEKKHPDNTLLFQLTNDESHPFRQAVNSSSKDTIILQLLANHYIRDPQFDKIVESALQSCSINQPQKQRFLKALCYLLPYTYAPQRRQAFIKSTHSSFTTAKAADDKHKSPSLSFKDQRLEVLNELRKSNQSQDIRFLLTLIGKHLGGENDEFSEILRVYHDIPYLPTPSPQKRNLLSPFFRLQRVTGNQPQPGPVGEDKIPRRTPGK